jgi:carboxymethylenebutenolidase
MPHTMLEIETADGRCPTHAYYPEGSGPWPGVIMFMDGIGMRSALEDMAARLSSSGYYVLLPDLFYRVGYKGEHGMNMFSDPAAREDFMTRLVPSASPDKIMSDTRSFLAHFENEPRAKHEKIGITGYCMGGRLAFIAAGTYGDRVAASAAYHPSGLATDKPDSPHLLAPKMRGKVYVGGAIEDNGFDDAQKAKLDHALTEAGVDHTVETYNARHGWVPSDTPAHDVVETERHWRSLLNLFGSTVGQGPTS